MSEPELTRTHTALVGVVAVAGLAAVLIVLIITSRYDRIDLWPVAAMVAACCALGLGVALFIARSRE